MEERHIDSGHARLGRGRASGAAREVAKPRWHEGVDSGGALKEGIAVPFGTRLRAVDGSALGRIERIGVDPFGAVNAFLTPTSMYPAAAMRSASEATRTVVVDPTERRRVVVVRELGRATRLWSTDDVEFRLSGIRLPIDARRPASVIVRPRPWGERRELQWSTVFVDGGGLPVAVYCRRRPG
jgi:hypothetical protein